MKLFAVIRKDLTQSFRSLFALAFMFLVPMLMTVLFYFIFGGVGGSEEQFDLPRTRVGVVNLDQGQAFSGDGESLLSDFPIDSYKDLSGVDSMGDLLTHLLLSETFSDILDVSVVTDMEAAKLAVDNQDAGVAIIIPEDFSAALTEPQATAIVELYTDPTLTLGPAIVESLVYNILDGFMSSKIAIGVALEQFSDAGGSIDPQVIEQIVAQSSAAATQGIDVSQMSGQFSLVEMVELDTGRETSMLASILGMILAGMAVFYLFFTGAASMQSILTEEEKGTLPRLFTTPTPKNTILIGKALAVFVILIVQVSVLLVFGKYVFNIYWGEPLEVIAVAVGVIILAGTTGLFIISWIKNTRQAGVVFGGVLTITGMLGMVTIFTGGTVSPGVERAALLVPQGWAVRAFNIAMDGGTLVDLLPVLGGILVWSLVFGVFGQYRLRRRYA
ncbi:MAG: ABC transporter permease [Chloroflexota bacterium]|nr:ABC transporter permease [Chloroflexota bacterium]